MPVDDLRPDQEGEILIHNGSSIQRADFTSIKQTAAAVTAGFSSGTGGAVLAGSTFTGNVGSTAYTIGDVVAALKSLGLIAS